MSRLPLHLYHRLPVPVRSAVASLRGYYLRWWRYGPETEQMVAEALDRESWSKERWRAFQEEQLARVLQLAATQVPYYREQWSARRRKGDRSSWEYLENWPILEKESLRQTPQAFLVYGSHRRRMYHLHTSGSTGKPLDLWWTRETARAWYALFEARVKRWNSVSTQERWAILGGQLVTPVEQGRPPFWVWNSALNQLYMSSYHLAAGLIPHYLRALEQYEIKYMLGYTSSLYALAQEILSGGHKPLPMAVIISNAEPLLSFQREAISAAFLCPVRETYGMAEIVVAASECQQGQLHLWPEVGWLEVLDGECAVEDGTIGDLVCTGFMNPHMPLVRYRVGDRGRTGDRRSLCACGRALPMLASVEGRIDDVLYTPDGRRIGRLDLIFKGQLPIREAQIIQETLDRVKVRYVPAPDFAPAAMRTVVEQLRMRMGAIEVTLEQVPELPRGASGKLRMAVCNLSREERQRLQNKRK